MTTHGEFIRSQILTEAEASEVIKKAELVKKSPFAFLLGAILTAVIQFYYKSKSERIALSALGVYLLLDSIILFSFTYSCYRKFKKSNPQLMAIDEAPSIGEMAIISQIKGEGAALAGEADSPREEAGEDGLGPSAKLVTYLVLDANTYTNNAVTYTNHIVQYLFLFSVVSLARAFSSEDGTDRNERFATMTTIVPILFLIRYLSLKRAGRFVNEAQNQMLNEYISFSNNIKRFSHFLVWPLKSSFEVVQRVCQSALR